MKKLLSILAVTALTATAATSVVACSPTKDNINYDKLVGMGIDRSKAVDDSNLQGKDSLGFTNFYTLGDSLSDYNGISTLISTALTNVTDLFDLVNNNVDMLLEMIKPMIIELLGGSIVGGAAWAVIEPIIRDVLNGAAAIEKINFQFQTVDENGNPITNHPAINNAFTDEKPAAVLFAERLGFGKEGSGGIFQTKNFNAGVNTNVAGLIDVKLDTPGNNYAIGGATSSDVHGISGLLLNSVQIHDQAEALLRDHKTKETDLVFLEIGGNDLFGMTDLADPNDPNKNKKEIEQKMDQAMANIRTALLSLLNNNVKNIIVSNAPDISYIPSYVKREDGVKEIAHDLSMEFNKRFDALFEEINSNYGNTMKMFNMAETFETMLVEFKAQDPENNNVTDSSLDMALGSLIRSENISPISVKEEAGVIDITLNHTLNKPEDETDNYFFWDSIHPREWAHKYVENILFDIAKKMSDDLGLTEKPTE